MTTTKTMKNGQATTSSSNSNKYTHKHATTARTTEAVMSVGTAGTTATNNHNNNYNNHLWAQKEAVKFPQIIVSIVSANNDDKRPPQAA